MAASMRTMVVVALAMIAFVVAPVQAQPPQAHPAHGATPTVGGVQNFTTADNSNIQLVVISPNGNWVAAASNSMSIFIFATSGSGGTLTPTATISLPADASAMALSNTAGSGSNPVLVVGVWGSLRVYDLPSSTPSWSYSSFASSGTANVTSVAVSEDGNAVAATVEQSPDPTKGSQHYTYSYFVNGVQMDSVNSTAFARATDVSMSIDGSRMAVGQNLNGVATIQLFQSSGGSQLTWSPRSLYSGVSNNLADAQISGNGVGLYEVSGSGFDTASYPGLTTAVSNLTTPASQLSVSYAGCQALVVSGSAVYYYNVSISGVGGCNATSFTTGNWAHAAWQASFTSTVSSISLASNNPSYFVVAWSSELQWFYDFPGLADGSQSAYRTISTDGNILSAAISATGTISTLGSAYEVGTQSELTIAQDSGAVIPAPLAVTATPNSASPGDPSASVTITWSAPPSYGFTSVTVSLTASNGGTLPSPDSIMVRSAGQTSATFSGLSFSTVYTATLVLVVYGGQAPPVESTSAAFTTATAPPVQDPFVYLEYVAIGVLVAGVVAYVILQTRLPKPPAPQPTPAYGGPAPGLAPQGPPGSNLPPAQRGNP